MILPPERGKCSVLAGRPKRERRDCRWHWSWKKGQNVTGPNLDRQGDLEVGQQKGDDKLVPAQDYGQAEGRQNRWGERGILMLG